MEFLFDDRAVLTRMEKIDRKWIRGHPQVKVIGSPTTGLDHIDLAECAKRGIKVVSLRDSPKFLKTITSTAEHTIGLMIALARGYKYALRGPYAHRTAYAGTKLAGKTLGIYGIAGRIGTQVAKIARAMGMKVIGTDPKLRRKEPLLLEESDIVSVHVTLEGNEGLFTREMFGRMRPTALFINTSRPGIVEKGSLLWALQRGRIAGAAMDFLDSNGLQEYAQKHGNLVLTNHIGGMTSTDRKLTDDFIIARMKAYVDNNRLS